MASLFRILKRLAVAALLLLLSFQLLKSTRKILTSPDVLTKDKTIVKGQPLGKLLDFETVRLIPWKPKDSFANTPRVTYINGHRGCNENMHGIMTHLKLNFKVMNPRKVARYGMTEAEAQKLIDSGFIRSLCSQSDVIVIADTLPDARGILLSLLNPDPTQRCSSKIIVESTNRFNWMIDDQTEYNQMLRNLTEDPPKNLIWTANNPFEEVYFQMRVGNAPKFELVRSLGVWNVDPLDDLPTTTPSVKAISVPDPNKIAMIDNVEPISYPKVVQLMKLNGKLDSLVAKLPKHYGGPQTLLGYKGFLEFPYQVSVMKFYENIAHGVPQLLPTPRFLKAIVKDAGYHHYFSHWLDKLEEASLFLSDPGKHAQLFAKGEFKDHYDASEERRFFKKLDGHYTAKWTELTDFYSHEFEPFVYYFDSFKELRHLLEIPAAEFDFMNVRTEGPKYYENVRRRSLERWSELLMSK